MSSLAVLHASQLVTLSGPKRRASGQKCPSWRLFAMAECSFVTARSTASARAMRSKRIAGDAEIVDAGGRVVLPGFVDAHTHLVFAGNRLDDFERRARGETYEQIAKAGGGIWSTVEKTRAASEADLLVQAKKHANWFLRCGTTTIEAKSGYGLTPVPS